MQDLGLQKILESINHEATPYDNTMMISVLAVEDVFIDGSRVTANNLDSSQPYRNKIKPSLGSQPLVHS